MKKLVVAALILVASLSQAQDIITKNIGDFSELKVFDKIDVKLMKGTENKVEISGISRKDVDIVHKDNILKVKMGLSNTWDNNNTVVTVYYTALKKIDVNEGATVKLIGVLTSEALDLRAQEGAKIYAEIATKTLVARAVSGGGLHLEGKATDQEVVVKAGGQYISESLKTINALVKISAGGRANVHASEYIKATTTAGGTIRIYGKPKQIDSKKTFGGKIIEIN